MMVRLSPHADVRDPFKRAAPDCARSAKGDVKMFQVNNISRITTLLMGAAVLGLAACAQETADEQSDATATEMPAGHPATDSTAPAAGRMQAPHGQVSVVVYQCADDQSFMLTVASGVGQAALRIDGEVYKLESQEVASGMEYSDGTYTFRGKGQEAFVEKDGEPLFTDCVATGHPQG